MKQQIKNTAYSFALAGILAALGYSFLTWEFYVVLLIVCPLVEWKAA